MNPAIRQFVLVARRYPLMVISTTLFVFLGLANYFLWEWQTELGQRHDRARQESQTMDLALTGHVRIAAQLATVQEALALIDKSLVVETDLAENLGYFYGLEKLSRIRLTQLNQLSPQPVEDSQPFKSIPFSLHINGSYAQVINFLHELETGPRLLKIKSYSFSRGTADADALALDLTVEALGRP